MSKESQYLSVLTAQMTHGSDEWFWAVRLLFPDKQEEADRQDLSFAEGLLGDSGSQEDLAMGTGSSDSTPPTRLVSE